MSLPDIDIDFCERRRGEVIEYVTRKYGRENVAQIITFGTMKAKAVVRDVGRVLEMPFADVDKVAKQIPPALDMTLDKALEESPALQGDGAERPERSRSCSRVARRLEGMTRHASVHAAGVVIAPQADHRVRAALQGRRSDEIVTQWAMKEIERVGLLKMDFLGLSTLTLIHDALDEIKRTDGRSTLDIDAIPLDDAKTYKLFRTARPTASSSSRARGMREHPAQGEAAAARRPDRAERALPSRPAASSGMVDDFIARKQGKTEVKYELPQLEPILADTYGVIAYQEQVMRIARGPGRVHAGRRPTCCARPWARRTPRSWPSSARPFVAGRAKNGRQREEGRRRSST